MNRSFPNMAIWLQGIVGVTILFSGQALAFTPITPAPVVTTHTTTVAAPPRSIVVGNQYYDASFKGLELYMDALRIDNPKLHAILQPDMARHRERIKRTRKTLLWIAIPSISLSIAFPFICLAAIEDEAAAAVIGGLGTGVLLGEGLSLLMFSSNAFLFNRRHLLGFINKHNRSNPPQEMRLQMGLLPGKSLGTSIGIAMRF